MPEEVKVEMPDGSEEVMVPEAPVEVPLVEEAPEEVSETTPDAAPVEVEAVEPEVVEPEAA